MADEAVLSAELYKWTNLWTQWQPRWCVLTENYRFCVYLNEMATQVGSRGYIMLSAAIIKRMLTNFNQSCQLIYLHFCLSLAFAVAVLVWNSSLSHCKQRQTMTPSASTCKQRTALRTSVQKVQGTLLVSVSRVIFALFCVCGDLRLCLSVCVCLRRMDQIGIGSDGFLH